MNGYFPNKWGCSQKLIKKCHLCKFFSFWHQSVIRYESMSNRVRNGFSPIRKVDQNYFLGCKPTSIVNYTWTGFPIKPPSKNHEQCSATLHIQQHVNSSLYLGILSEQKKSVFCWLSLDPSLPTPFLLSKAEEKLRL